MITFIGDVHGWLDRLESILQQEPNGAYLFLGDLIDRGPDSKAVVNKVQALCSSGKARCIIGNHEYALGKRLLKRVLALFGLLVFFNIPRQQSLNIFH